MSSAVTAEAQGRYRGRVVIVRPYRPFRSTYGYGYGYRPYGYPYGSFSPYSHYVFSSNEAAENQGYHDGLKTGSEDGRKDKSFNPERSHYFQEAGFGNFAEAYRNGFLRGYEDGYRS